jgi:hypothetical protein
MSNLDLATNTSVAVDEMLDISKALLMLDSANEAV